MSNQTPNIVLEDQIKDYMENLKKSGKPFCSKCYDDRDVEKVSGTDWLCKDCIYMMNLLEGIKKI